MTDTSPFDSHDPEAYGRVFDELWPICRSISGPGLRQSLDIMGKLMGVTTEGVESGTQVFDWVVPPEWTIRSARLTGPDGRIVADMARGNLAVLNYSEPVDEVLSLEALQPHLHSIPDQPTLTPYVTSYYRRDWGFCLPHVEREALPDGAYHARIDSTLGPGTVDFATGVIEGESDREILLTSYLCHPSMANNELSGPLVLLGLYHRILAWPRRRRSYRFLLNPETIGSLCFLHRYADRMAEVLDGGLVLTCLGGPSEGLSYKASRRGDTGLDRLMAHLAGDDLGLRPFNPTGGSDERQFCAPGFNLPMGQMARTIYGQYPEYHTSGDTRDLMGLPQIVEAVDRIEEMLLLNELRGPWVGTAQHGEPQLGRRGLYPSVNSPTNWHLSNDDVMDSRQMLNMLLWIVSDADGKRDLLETAQKSGFALRDMVPVIRTLEDKGLIRHHLLEDAE